MLSACATINDLDLDWDSHLTTVTALRLWRYTCANHHKLSLLGTCVDDSGLETLARMFSKLEYLELEYCHDVTDVGVNALMRHGAPCLRWVGLNNLEQITADVCASTSFELRDDGCSAHRI